MTKIEEHDSNKSFYFLLLIVFLLPIPLGANRPWAWSFFELAIFGLTLFVLIKHWQTEKLGLKSYFSILYFWFAFIILGAIQIIPLPDFIIAALSPSSYETFADVSSSFSTISIDPAQSTISFIKLLSFFCLFICILALVNSEKRIRALLMTIMAAGTLQAIYGSLEILLDVKSSIIFGLPVGEVATGSFVYKNHYANFLILSLSAAVGLMVTSLEKSGYQSSKDIVRSFATSLLSSKAIVRICIIIMVIALVMSRSRMGNAAFFISMAIVGAIAFFAIKNRSKGLTILVISMFIVDLLIISTYFGLERVKDRLAQTSMLQETRDEVINDAFPIISDFPLFGSGAGSFYSTFPSYQVSEVHSFYDHLHNDYLQFVIEHGLLGTFILVGLMTFCLFKSIRAMRKRRNSIFKGSAFACLMIFVAMGMHMTVDFPLQGYANASYFVIFLALSMIINSLKIHPVRKKVSS